MRLEQALETLFGEVKRSNQSDLGCVNNLRSIALTMAGTSDEHTFIALKLIETASKLEMKAKDNRILENQLHDQKNLITAIAAPDIRWLWRHGEPVHRLEIQHCFVRGVESLESDIESEEKEIEYFHTADSFLPPHKAKEFKDTWNELKTDVKASVFLKGVRTLDKLTSEAHCIESTVDMVLSLQEQCEVLVEDKVLTRDEVEGAINNYITRTISSKSIDYDAFRAAYNLTFAEEDGGTTVNIPAHSVRATLEQFAVNIKELLRNKYGAVTAEGVRTALEGEPSTSLSNALEHLYDYCF